MKRREQYYVEAVDVICQLLQDGPGEYTGDELNDTAKKIVDPLLDLVNVFDTTCQEPYDVKDRLPDDGTWVLAHYNGNNWGEDKGQYWVVAKFIRGLSNVDRQALSDTDERKQTIKAQDELGNNQRAFCWTTFGHPNVVSQGSKVGQAVDYWMPIPTVPEKGNDDGSQVRVD